MRRTLLQCSHYSSHTNKYLSTHYDYIITGSGCAGLSLLYRFIQNPYFSNKQILVIDKEPKTQNDRTWCFWEKNAGLFEEIVFNKWSQIDFMSNEFSARIDIEPYEYKMINSLHFYQHIISKAKLQNNIHFLYGNIQSVFNKDKNEAVTVEGKIYTANYIFNSIIFEENIIKSKHDYSLLQHFKGWVIETPANVFNEKVATFMDFRVNQKHGTTFTYVLPILPNKALIEYTLFTEKLLEHKEYDNALTAYIKDQLSITEYKIVATEFGVIPMTNANFSKGEGGIVNLGTAGGKTKPSSGYTFMFIQKHSDAIIKALLLGNDPHIKDSFFQKRFRLYDNILLNALTNKKLGGDKIFVDLFKKNPVQRLFRFLDNETNPVEELKLVNTVPTNVFLPAAVRELFR